MRNLVAIIVFAVGLSACRTEAPGPMRAGDVVRHVQRLAADDMAGRGAGYPGEENAAAYIADRFRDIGLKPPAGVVPPGFIRTFPFHPRGPVQAGQILTSRNVTGILEGSDPVLRDEIVLLGAHHDGQGRAGQAQAGRYPALLPGTDEIWNSADDNASSVAVVIEVAHALAAAGHRPRRSIVFATFGAEEHALNGAAHYVTDPPWPLPWHVAMVNLEKLGRVPDQELVTAASATSPDWDPVIATVNSTTGRNILPVVPEIILDTDHYPFAATGIPAITVGTAHEEDTHRPTDEAALIAGEALASRADAILALVTELANRDQAPRYRADRSGDPGVITMAASGVERALVRDALPGRPSGEPAVLKVGVVIPGLPAARAGLRAGDLVVEVDGRPLPPEADEETLPAAYKEDHRLDLTVIRDAQRLTITVGGPTTPAAQRRP